jgi:hypothetical protein
MSENKTNLQLIGIVVAVIIGYFGVAASAKLWPFGSK